MGFRAPREVAALFELALLSLRRATGILDDGALVSLMLVEFAHDHAAEEAPLRRRHRIFARDGWK